MQGHFTLRCEHCTTTYTRTYPSRFCSPTCRNKARTLDPGRLVTGACEFCGKQTQSKFASQLKRFCSRRCSARHTAPVRSKTPEEFLACVQKGDPGACWPWTGARQRQGYGICSYGGQGWLTHRLAFFLFTGTHPGELCVCHRCDNPPCCNPTHLFLGTQADNTRDMVEKGRERHPFGSAHGRAKLADADVIAILDAYHVHGENLRTIASRYPVHKHSVRSIVRGESWLHLTRPYLRVRKSRRGRDARP